jgi:hypothetical protein
VQSVNTPTAVAMAAVTRTHGPPFVSLTQCCNIGLARKMQNNKMSKIVKFATFIACSGLLLADVLYVAWATKLNLLIVVPVALSAAYLSYAAANWTILNRQ